MKQLIQSYRTGKLGLYEVPSPNCLEGGVLVKTSYSLISAGTEKMIVDLAKKSVIGKARARPDLMKQVIRKMKQEGIVNTINKVLNKLDTPIPLGYSCSGRVVEVGNNVTGISRKDRVACAGIGYANHSEINYVPKNLFIKVPDDVDDIDASFVTVGAIALQGVRQAEPKLGDNVAVIGLGLIGQIIVQLLKANGCKVIGSDIDSFRMDLAKRFGSDKVCHSKDLIEAINEFSHGYGVDSVIIAASTSSNQPIIDAGEIARMKANVIVLGCVGMDIPRNQYYKKELNLRLSMSYGPGRYDPTYEEKGIDYPYGYVRWTEQRNFEAFLSLVAEKKVSLKELITHKFNFEEVLRAYDLIEGKTEEKYLGIVLHYNDITEQRANKSIVFKEKSLSDERINIGLIGGGNFAKSVLLPNLKKLREFELVGLCTATGVSCHTSGKKYGFQLITTDSEEIYKNSKINSVFVTTRHNDHADKVLKALEHKKHIFVEKPLCTTEDDLALIKEAYSKMDDKVILQVGFNRRFSPFIQKMKKALGNHPMSIIYRINAGIIPLNMWVQDQEIGGGRIVGEVCHFIDTCTYLTGYRPVSVFASCLEKDDKSIPKEDNVSIILNFRNGSIANIFYMAYGNTRMPKEYIEIFSTNLSMQMNDFKEMVIYKKNKRRKFKATNQDKGFMNELKAFERAVKSGIPAIPFESIYQTTKTTFKILESIKNKALVEI